MELKFMHIFTSSLIQKESTGETLGQLTAAILLLGQLLQIQASLTLSGSPEDKQSGPLKENSH